MQLLVRLILLREPSRNGKCQKPPVDEILYVHYRDGSEIRFTENLYGNINGPNAPADGALRLALPVESPANCPLPVIELFLDK